MSNSLSSSIDNCSFIENIAQHEGSALYLISIETTLIHTSSFLFNSAVNGAGAVYWVNWTGMSEPFGIGSLNNTLYYNNTFIGNNASYGSMWATEAVLVMVDEKSNYHYNVTDYSSPLPPIALNLVDYYLQIVSTDTYSTIEASTGLVSCYSSSAYITGGVNEISNNEGYLLL